MTQKGVNLGGWLVLEQWITPSLFDGTDAHDELSLVSLGKSYQKRVLAHYKTFITRKDIAWLHDHGVTQLRVPVGYWIFGKHAPFLSGIKYLDQLFDWAAEFDMKIILSIHAAPGSQNGKLHSGKIGEANWHKYIDQLTAFTLRVAERYKTSEQFIGLGILNEPDAARTNIWRLVRYYRTIARKLKQQNPSQALYIDGTFRPWLWMIVARMLSVDLDLHLYHGFDDGTDINKAQKRLTLSARLLRRVHPSTIIGEWSGVIDQQPDQATTTAYIRAQQQAYSPFANFYWTYKTESGGYWSFQKLREK